LKKQWCIPQVNAEYVAAMEDVLDLYAEPYDPTRPKVNFDETNKQLIQETRQPLPAEPGQPERYDYEYERKGTRNVFLFTEPQAGWRHINVTEQRTMLDFAQQMKWLVDERYPQAEKIRVVLDNLNTHKPASLYETFTPAEARRLLTKLEFHYTPKHGSWLNMAEIELSVLQRQCLDRRIPDEETLKREIAAWEEYRNVERATIDWRFSVTDAREKLKQLYPSPPS
jgi:transposase